MNALKKFLGLVWIGLAVASAFILFQQALEKTAAIPEGIQRTNAGLQWGIILFIYLPIAIGLIIFGVYSLKGEYDSDENNT